MVLFSMHKQIILPFIIALQSNKLPFIQFLEIFLSSINLNLGFPLCFYDGMNEFLKTVLSLVFPIYLLAIVVAVIFLSHYSVWVSNRTSQIEHLTAQCKYWLL